MQPNINLKMPGLNMCQIQCYLTLVNFFSDAYCKLPMSKRCLETSKLLCKTSTELCQNGITDNTNSPLVL